MTNELGNCECGAQLMDAGPLGVNCSNINCPVEKTIVQQVAKAFQNRREQAPSKEQMQEQLTNMLYSLHLVLDVNKDVPQSVRTSCGTFQIRNWLCGLRDRLHKFEEAFRASNEPRPDAVEALRPFVELYEKADERYRKRGGNPDQFRDTHPFSDIPGGDLPMGVWRRAQAAFRATQPPADALKIITDLLATLNSCADAWRLADHGCTSCILGTEGDWLCARHRAISYVDMHALTKGANDANA